MEASMKKLSLFIILSVLFMTFTTIHSANAIETTISDGTPGPTVRIASTDTATALPTSVLTVLGVSTRGAIISVETYAIRVAFGGTTPTQGASGVGHYIEAGGGIRVYGLTAMQNLKYINSTNGQNAIIQVTPLY